MTAKNRKWILIRRPEGPLTPDIFELESSDLPQPEKGQALVRVLDLSLDPANRLWIVGPSYRREVALGAVMDGFAVGEVVESMDPRLAAGDVVTGDLGWQDFSVRRAGALRKVQLVPGTPLSLHIGVLGVTGLTAYFGLLDVGRPRPGQTVLVSAAAGATGSVVGQIAKIGGCRVVGIAGGPEKCAWLDELGFDAAIDRKAGDVAAAIKKHCPNGVDVYFDNVGGEILDAALFQMKRGGTVVCCGAISGYDTGKAPTAGPSGVPGVIIGSRLRMEGFIVTDYAARFAQGLAALASWLESGQVRVREDRVDGLENAPAGLVGLLAGANIGKRFVHVADPSPGTR